MTTDIYAAGAPSFATDPRCACRGVSTELFFPRANTPRGQVERAQGFCFACPLRAECLDYAMSAPSIDGIWGGTTTPQRERMRRSARLGRAAA